MINIKNIKVGLTLFTKGIGITCIATMHTFSPLTAFAQQPNCVNYWTNPDTGKTQCFSSEMNLIAEPKPILPQSQSLSYNSSFLEQYNISGQEITIPAPDRYVRVTQEMDAVYRLHRSMEDPLNDFLASYIPQSEAAIAIQGEMPISQRGFALKIIKMFKSMSVSSQDFAAMKDEIKTYNRNILASEMPKLQKIINKTGQDISQEFGLDFTLNLSQIIPLDAHYESDNVLSYSLYMVYQVSEGGVQDDYVIVATATLVNVSGKVVSLYSYGAQSDLEWTQSASKVWADKVNASN